MIKLIDLLGIRYTIAHGKTSFKMKRGSFRYRDRITERKILTVHPKEVSDKKLSITLTDDDGRQQGRVSITDEGDGLFHIRQSWRNPQVSRISLTIPVSRDEHYYGCGETFTKFDLAGENVRIWVAEHQNSDRIAKKVIRQALTGKHPEKVSAFHKYESYYAQPTVVSSSRYFIHVRGSGYMEFDFRKNGYVTLRLHEPDEIIIGQAASFAALSEKLANLVGYQPELPKWCYDGVILAVQEGPQRIDQKLRIAEQYHIPVTGVWSQDWCGCRRTKFGYQVMWNWEYDKKLYPDLPGKIREWNQKGIHFLGYINPFLALEKPLYREASAKGYCVKNKKGEDYLVTITTFPAAMIDFTNPDAYAWYKEIIKKNLIGIGLSGWMADFGEYLPPDAVLFNGVPAEVLHNLWPALWAKMNREAVHESGKDGEVFFFTRAGTSATVKYSSMMWNGDQHVDFSMDDGLPSVIPASLSLAMSGYGLTHSDVGGYTTMRQMTRNEELLMRWEELNAFSPLMRFHEGNQPSRNVQFDTSKKLLLHLKRMAEVHQALKGYLQDAVHQNSVQALPVMRPLFYHYDEPRAYREAYEYLLGRDILVAPVIREKVYSRTVYLPNDDWVHLFTGKKYQGGIITVPAPIGLPPVFIRDTSQWKESLLSAIRSIYSTL